MTSVRIDPDHDRVCACDDDHLLVTAPPGTGKTFLTIRLAGTLSTSLSAGSRILVLTFSNQARTQLEREARRQLTSEQRRHIEVTNYHRFFWKAVLSYRRLLGLPMELDIGSSQRRRNAFRAALGTARVKELDEVSKGLLDCVAEHAFSRFRDERTPKLDELTQLLEVVRRETAAGRLVFDDLGALFWKLLEQNPAVADAYTARYPVAIADEHQDASALQDAIVRRFGSKKMIVMADEMQLIHGFRGASCKRIDSHRSEGPTHETLGTPHRWHSDPELAQWLLALRKKLQGGSATIPRPPNIVIQYTDSNKGINGVKSAVKYATLEGFRQGHRSIAVLARKKDQVAQLRDFLTKQDLFPRETGTADFEEARQDIEQLPLDSDAEAVARHALLRLETLLPTLPRKAWDQATARIGSKGVNLKRAGKNAKILLEPLQSIFDLGPGNYFEALASALSSARENGHHLPRTEAVHAIRQTALALQGATPDLDQAIRQYSYEVMAATQVAPRANRGLSVMTAHQSKGKEFDLVILADMSRRYFPADTESIRLFYVSMTRATRKTVVIAPNEDASPLLDTL